MPVTLVMGGSLDVVRATSLRITMQQALDGAVLAASPLNQTREAEAATRDFFDDNIRSAIPDPENVSLVITSNVDATGKSVTATATYTYDTIFLPLIGRSELDIVVEAGARQGWQNVEISLVVDVSGSMRHNGKIASLREAAEEFVDIILTEDVEDFTTISLIPFATHVNVGNEFMEFLMPGSVDTNKDNNFTDGHRWIGCINMRPEHHTIDGFENNSIQPLPEYESYRICPEDRNKAIFQSNDATALKNAISGLIEETCPACYTGIDEGAAFGLKALTPDSRGVFDGTFKNTRPADYHGDTIKALVIMTDGFMDKYYRPATCWNYTLACSEYPIQESHAEATLRTLCNAAREEGIIVFTVGFQIPAGSTADQLMADCGGDSFHYFFVETSDLEAAFSQIAGFIRAVRLVG